MDKLESSCSSTSEVLPDRRYRVIRASSQRDVENPPIDIISRVETARSQYAAVVGIHSRSRNNTHLPGFGGGKPYPPKLEPQDAYVVDFDGPDDPIHAMNWPFRKKLWTSIILAYTTFIVAFNSALFSAATTSVSTEFHVSSEVGVLGVSFYVLGFATGPLFWAPLCELKGRRWPLVIGVFGFAVFNLGVASGKDLQTVLLCRFWGGIFGGSPMTIVGAIFADMYDDRTRGLALTIFSMNVLTAPLLAPFVGGFITASSMGWRWTGWLAAIMGFVAFGLDLFLLDETYAPIILVNKATAIRRQTQNWAVHAKQDEIHVDWRELISKNFGRPLHMLFTEPLNLLLSIYLAFIYGLLYLFLTAYPIVFQDIHGMRPGVSGLPYLAMVIGMFCAGFYIISTQPSYARKLAANNNVIVPEWRLPPVMVGGVAFAGGVFWLGWGGYKADIHWIVPTLSGLLTGFGLLAIFLQGLNYLVDTYIVFAASAMAGSTMLRSLCGAGFPLFAKYMFKSLGVNWAGTVLGCVATVMIPIPVAFWLWGPRLRAHSRYTTIE